MVTVNWRNLPPKDRNVHEDADAHALFRVITVWPAQSGTVPLTTNLVMTIFAVMLKSA